MCVLFSLNSRKFILFKVEAEFGRRPFVNKTHHVKNLFFFVAVLSCLRAKMVQVVQMSLWTILSLTLFATTYSLKKEDCEVCITVVERFSQSLSDSVRKDTGKIEREFRAFCKTSKTKENRFCYYLGGLDESATGILSELSKPLSWNMPADKVCEKLKKKDAQICDLRYDKQIDLNAVDLKKLKVRDLKKILSDWDEDCDGCIEKSEFIKRIEELKPKFVKTEL